MRPIPYPPIKEFICGPQCYRFLGVYKVVLGMALTFLTLTICLLGVESSRNPRSIVQDGFWPLKLVSFILIIGGVFVFAPTWLLTATFVPACLLSGLFLLAQSVLLVDFSYDLVEWLLEQAESVYEGWNWYQISIVTITICSQAFNFFSSIAMWIYYPSDRSRLTVMATFGATVTMSICSVLEAVREVNPTSGLFQSSLLGSYMMFLVISAVLGDPSLKVGGSEQATDTVGYIAVFVTVVSVAYSAYSTGHSSHKFMINPTDPAGRSDLMPDIDDEGDEVTEYNYAIYQFVFVCAALYMGLLITGWKMPVILNGTFTLIDARLTFWVKAITSWVIGTLYVWSLFAPLILTDRDFF
jgi:serine incorporator 1/3